MASFFENYARVDRLAGKINAFYDEKDFDPQDIVTVFDALDDEFPELSKLSRDAFNKELDELYIEWGNTPAVERMGMLPANFVAAKVYEKYIAV